MATFQIIQKYNMHLLKEKYYENKFHPSKKIIPKINLLINSIRNKYNNDIELEKSSLDDSLNTIDAMNNPYMRIFTEDNKLLEEIGKKQKIKNQIFNQRIRSSIKSNNNIPIKRYCDSIKLKEKKKKDINIFVVKNYSNNYKNLSPKSISIRNNCVGCKNFSEDVKKGIKNRYKIYRILDKHFNMYANSNKIIYKDSFNCFLSYLNNLNKTESNNKLEFIDYIRTSKNKHKGKDLKIKTNLDKNDYKLIQRYTFDINNLYNINKPLIPSIRAKIIKYTKQRCKKPIRAVISCKNRESRKDSLLS